MIAQIRRLALICLVASTPASLAYAAEDATIATSKLIDDLASIDSQAPGIDAAASYEWFIAEDTKGKFDGGMLGVPAPVVPLPMRELVRRGASALPTLIAHLGDARPTKLAVGNEGPGSDPNRKSTGRDNYFMFSYFSDEYEPRTRPSARRVPHKALARDFTRKYVVKVGDVCYAIIGQIVNRRLLPVRYKPTAGLVVNSPIEVPELIERVTDDWGKATPEMLKASLLSDISDEAYRYLNEPALARLRFYFPETYGALAGKNLTKKREFESRRAADRSSK